MKNYLLIQLTQRFPTWVNRCLIPVRKLRAKSPESAPPVIEEINHFNPDHPKPKLALVTLNPREWLTAVQQHPNIRLYNHSGFVYSIVQALNDNGFKVDLVDTSHPFKVDKHYDLCMGHGGGCAQILEQLPEGIPIYQYISGLQWKVFEDESNDRYKRFFDKHGGQCPKFHRRDVKHLIESLEMLNQKADVMFSINCPRMVGAYGPHVEKFFYTGLGAYVDPMFEVSSEAKDYEAGRKNFLYVGGTGGNLQKGIDLLIEAFAEMPDLNLYIYCKIEEEILEHCRDLLAKPNIHYIYHWRYKWYQSKINDLMKRCNFSVHAPINIGMGTAFMATLGNGIIPVGYVDVHNPDEDSVLTESWQVEDLIPCIRAASEKSTEWCEEASKRTRKRYDTYCDPDEVRRKQTVMFSTVPPYSAVK